MVGEGGVSQFVCFLMRCATGQPWERRAWLGFLRQRNEVEVVSVGWLALPWRGDYDFRLRQGQGQGQGQSLYFLVSWTHAVCWNGFRLVWRAV